MELQELFIAVGNMLGIIFPIFLPILLGFVVFNLWVNYAKRKFASDQKYVLIRIIPPREVTKTPAAMELFITGLHQTGGEATKLDVYWKGKSRATFALEIASIGGDVGFYVWTRESLRPYIEGQIYAQYAGIEVVEVEDYVEKIDYSSGDYTMFGLEYKLTEPDPVPIKTYVDYGLDKASEEEEKVDPITATLEFLGSLKSGENAWIQINIKAHKKEDKKSGKFFEKTDSWIDQAKTMVAEIKKEGVFIDPNNKEARPIPMQTKAQEEKINAIERNISKLGFDVGIRSVYIAENDAFTGTNIPGLIGSFRQYNSNSLNGFKPAKVTDFDYWWQDPTKSRLVKLKDQMFKDYKKREYFGTKIDKMKRKKFILNTEELATIFHFPGGVASTPTLTRIQSRKGEAPTNLPM
jgi:acyl-CoA thioesterase FadM